MFPSPPPPGLASACTGDGGQQWRYPKPHSHSLHFPSQITMPTTLTAIATSTMAPKLNPLSRQIDPWIWTSLALSVTSLFLFHYTNANANSHSSIFMNTSQLQEKTHIAGQNDTEQSGSTALLALGANFGAGLGFEALLVVIIFYGTILLILSSKERQLSDVATLAAPAPLSSVVWARGESEYKSLSGGDLYDDIEEDKAEEVVAEEKRRSAVIWILAVSQSGLAAVGLYVAARLVLIVGGFAETETGHPIVECFELVYALGEMGMLMYIAVCCLVQASGRCESSLERSGEK